MSQDVTEDEVRRVLHKLCVYAYDNHTAFRVVAHGVDGAGDGVLQFGIDSHPEDMNGSNLEQLVERLSLKRRSRTILKDWHIAQLEDSIKALSQCVMGIEPSDCASSSSARLRDAQSMAHYNIDSLSFRGEVRGE